MLYGHAGLRIKPMAPKNIAYQQLCCFPEHDPSLPTFWAFGHLFIIIIIIIIIISLL